MPIDSCKDDFKEVHKYFSETQNIFIPFEAENIGSIKKIHETTYAYLILKSKLNIKNNANIFLSEIQSDYLQLMPLLLKGYEKLVMILLRDILENTLKFIYYFHHPIEFSLLEEKSKNYIFFEDLIKYVCEHPSIKSHTAELNLLNRIKPKYSELSKFVHSKDGNYMHFIKYLKQIKFNKEFSEKFLIEFKEIHSLTISLLILFLNEKYSSFSIPYKRFILNSILKTDKIYITSL
ncbi:MAG: hypothetical protein A3G23_02945 [Bacteroidetes bacterium RIFCSPLOWO2_12_FULL_37_12]|nr:MAG: hypothetical protein A3G23_02945 [Bacteroidetes bacterium RIFCSPLOWO2_12_FULL_37_12]